MTEGVGHTDERWSTIAPTPAVPYVAVIFTSLRTPDHDGYAAMTAEMERLARRQDGYLGVESARDGLGITVSYWRDERAAKAWKGVAEHVMAQQLGRARWYRDYQVRVATVTREYGKPSAGSEEAVSPDTRGPAVDPATSPRHVFEQAAAGFLELVTGLTEADWRSPALGEWDVLALVGHTSRALSTIETYLAAASGEAQLHDPVDYFLAVLADPSDRDVRARQDVAVAARGRQAGADLGEDPADEVARLAARVVGLLPAIADDAPVATPAGTMRLADYLPTRTFELTVHSLDLARAIGVPPPALLAPAITATWQLAARLASRRANAADLLLGLLGRDLPGQSLSAL